MRKFKILSLVLCIVLLFSGCRGFRFAASIDELIGPISPSGDNAGVQNALDEYCKGGYAIKNPSSGSYKTSFVFKDITGDGNDEAVAFYMPYDETGSICMAVISKNNDKWSVVANVKGEATDVNSVDFSDLNNDKTNEVIVCWSVISKKTGFKINVYSLSPDKDKVEMKSLSKPIASSDFICADVNEDGTNELLVFNSSSYSGNSKAELYSFAGNNKKFLGSTKLDSSITEFRSICVGETDEGLCVYADGVKSDASSVVTEFIYWSNYYNSIISPFYSYSTGKTKATSRNNSLICRDIDNDNTIEIPLDASISDLPAELDAQNWKSYGNTVLNHKCYTLSCRRDNYVLVIPDRLFDKITVSYSSDERRLYIAKKDNKKKGITIITVFKSNFDNRIEEYSGYQEIFSDSGFIYLAGIDESSKLDISIDDLKNMIRPF